MNQASIEKLLDRYAEIRANNWDASEAATLRDQVCALRAPGRYAYRPNKAKGAEQLVFIAIGEHSETHRLYAVCVPILDEMLPRAIPFADFYRGGESITIGDAGRLMRDYWPRVSTADAGFVPGYWKSFKRDPKAADDSYRYAGFGVVRMPEDDYTVGYTALYPPHAGHLLLRPRDGKEAGFLGDVSQRQVASDGLYSGPRFKMEHAATISDLSRHLL